MIELTQLTATECVSLLKKGEVNPSELLEACRSRIEEVDGGINALPIHCFDRANKLAASVSRDTVLAGLPIAVKDYNNVGDVRTTFGSPIFKDYVPAESDATVKQLESNGAIPVAKSNVPEWAGGNTFNPVFGATKNPWNTKMTAGGSSGGSAAALASGQVWLATGNDLGGSLRTPASFNGVVGLRPSPGRVPRGIRLQPFDSLWVEGPMGRCVSDVALMLDAGAGFSSEDPLSFSSSPDMFSDAVKKPCAPKRVAFSADLGQVAMSRDVAGICQQAAMRLKDLGTEVTDDIPDFSEVIDGFQTLRAVLIATMMGELLEQHRESISPDIVGNIERGLDIRPEEIFTAERVRWQLHKQMTDFFQTHDLLICPAVSIPPFPVEQQYVKEIDGKPLETYIDWFSITFILSMSACPVVCLPCGFTDDGLPIGVQLVGKPRGEAQLLAMARQIEQLFGISQQLPITPGNIVITK